MKTFFYGSIAIAAIADMANAVSLDDEEAAIVAYAQNDIANIQAAEDETALATVDSEAAGHSENENELDAWSDLSSEGESDADLEADSMSDSLSEMSDEEGDLDLAQTECDAEAEMCPCQRSR